MESKLTPTISKILRIVVPIGVSAAMLLWLLHKVDLKEIESIMARGVDYRYLVLMMAFVVLSHIIRGIRWGIQLRAAGVPRMTWLAESVSIFGAYALNLIVTYLGEGWRCVYVSTHKHVKLATVIGTDIGDRGSDAVMIVLISLLSLAVARPAMAHFFDHYRFGSDIVRDFSSPMVWVYIIVGLMLLAGIAYVMRHSKRLQGVVTSIRRMWDGFRVLFDMKGWQAYIALTFGIWICYYLQTYVCFMAFPFTRELMSQPGTFYGMIPGLVVFVFGSFSMAIPSSGGLGPWNIAVMYALTLYGISQVDATAYSLVCWAFQAATLIAEGIFAAAYVTVTGRK